MRSLFRRPRALRERLAIEEPVPRAVAGLAALASSALVVAGALLAALTLRLQLRELAHQQAGAARPYLVVRGAQAVRAEDWLAVILENIGSGPALDIDVEGRLIEEPPGWPETADWYVRQMVRAAFANEEERVHPRGDLHAIAAGERSTVWFYGRWPASDDREGIIYFLGAHLTYHDLFGNELRGGLDGELWSTITYPEE